MERSIHLQCVLQLMYYKEVIRRSERLSGAHPSTLLLLLVPSRSYVTDRPSYLVAGSCPHPCSALSGIHRSWVSNTPFHEAVTCRLAIGHPLKLGNCDGGEGQVLGLPK
jgi:hypothetical protein